MTKTALNLFAAFLAMIMAGTAVAETTLYTDSSNFGGWPNAVNGGNAVGAPDGAFASIPNGGWIAFQTTQSFTDANFVLNLTSVTGSGTALFYVGRSNGAGWFSALNNRTVTLNNGLNVLSSVAQTNYCTFIGGCDVFLVQAWAGSSFGIDAARSVSTNPEPSVWALMIIAFAGVGGRLKYLRVRKSISGLTQVAAA